MSGMFMSGRRAVVMSMVFVGLSGCFTAKKKFGMPPPVPMAEKPPPEPQFATPPDIEVKVPEIGLEPVGLEFPPAMEPPPTRPVQARKPAPGPVAPAPTPAGPPVPDAEPPAPTPAPQLGEILTNDRRQQYETQFRDWVSGAQTALGRANGKTLTPRQKETIQRIKTFLQQAEETKEKDLVTALEFARRADLFGKDLLKSLQ